MGLNFTGYDPFMILFTVFIVWGFIRQVRMPERNGFAFGFAAVSLLVFGLVDVLMVMNWFDVLDSFSAWIFGA